MKSSLANLRHVVQNLTIALVQLNTRRCTLQKVARSERLEFLKR